MSIDFNQLRELLGAIAQTDITELILKSEDFELTVRKSLGEIPSVPSVGTNAVYTAPVPLPTPQTATPTTPPPTSVIETPVPSPIDKQWVEITSPMVGTFYRAPAPDEPPFVEVGDRITKGQTVCIIEAMKLMNEIEAEVSGEITEIIVQNGQPIEYGQTLMWVSPT